MSIDNLHRLAFVGPRDADHGFPMFYEDETGTRLSLAISNDPFTPAVGERPDPGSPPSFSTNFPDEAFYFLAESRMSIGGAGPVGRARLVLALEAAFGGAGVPDPASRVVFSRIRVRMDDVIPGADYVITHPYGRTDPLTADENGRVFVTEDLGLADEQLDAVVAVGRVAPFLRWAGGAPMGYLGDGASERTVTGSPFGTNFFRVDGPNVGAAGGPVDPSDPGNPDRIQSPLFTVQGQLAVRSGVEITAASYTRTGAATVIDVHATSAPGQTVELGGAGAPRAAFGSRDRAYTVRADVGSVPLLVEAVNVTDTPVSRARMTVVDRVDVDQALFSPGAQTLTVAARSSDDLDPALAVEGFGPVTASPMVFTGVGAVPAVIAVTSAAGGRALRAVALDGPAALNLPVLADAGPAFEMVTGSSVQLDGTGSRGPITAWAWTQDLGLPVVLSDSSTPTPTFTAPAPGPLRFTLTVQGVGGPSSSTVDLTVTVVPPPDQIVIQQAQFRTSRQQFRIGGRLTGVLPSIVTVQVDGAQLGVANVDATGAWDVRRTLTAAEVALRPQVGDQVEVRSTHGGPVLAAVSIRN